MAKKTNKTSHVMDLLTNGASGEVNEPAGESAASPETQGGQEKKGDVQSHTVSPKKVTVVDEGSRNDRLSQEILSKLSEELEADAAAGAQAAAGGQPSAEASDNFAAWAAMTEDAPEPSPDSPAEAEAPETEIQTPDVSQAIADAPDSQESGEAAPEPSPAPAPKKEPLPGLIPKSRLQERLMSDKYHFVNVMELLLLRQDIDSYMEQYNVCKCDRCLADVCALVLSGLPAKYVVAGKNSVSPILGYYESKFKIYMLTELIKACNKVREHPRH